MIGRRQPLNTNATTPEKRCGGIGCDQAKRLYRGQAACFTLAMASSVNTRSMSNRILTWPSMLAMPRI
jgi:hypothetical protein